MVKRIIGVIKTFLFVISILYLTVESVRWYPSICAFVDLLHLGESRSEKFLRRVREKNESRRNLALHVHNPREWAKDRDAEDAKI